MAKAWVTDFGIISRKLRLERRVSAGELCDRLGISTGYLSAMEVGRAPVPMDMAYRITQALGMGEEDAEAIKTFIGASDRHRKVVPLPDSLTLPQRRTALSLIRALMSMGENNSREELAGLIANWATHCIVSLRPDVIEGHNGVTPSPSVTDSHIPSRDVTPAT